MPAGYNVFNVDTFAVSDANSPERKFIMSIEVNHVAGKQTDSWVTIFAETLSATPNVGWKLVDPLTHSVDRSRMTACPAVRYFDGWYYVATTTRGTICPSAGWSNSSNALCVILYRSKTLKEGGWTMGNMGKPIIFPGADDRKIAKNWNATDAERAAIFGHAPQALGDINNSDFDFCDTKDGVFGLFAGIANQQSNPYFNIAALAKGTTSAKWLAGYFDSS
jgi:hypothetical protein